MLKTIKTEHSIQIKAVGIKPTGTTISLVILIPHMNLTREN